MPISPLPKQHDVMVKVFEIKEWIAVDQTGKFPITSSKGAKYIMVLCEIDGNAILTATVKNRSEGGDDLSLPFVNQMPKRSKDQAQTSDF